LYDTIERGSSIPAGNCPDFFPWIPVNFLCFPAATGRKSSEKSENFPVGILLPQNHWNHPEPAVSGPGCSTWVDNQVVKYGKM
jgi:hypothetical protein